MDLTTPECPFSLAISALYSPMSVFHTQAVLSYDVDNMHTIRRQYCEFELNTSSFESVTLTNA